MKSGEGLKRFFGRPDRLSFAFMLVLIVATAWLHLSSLLVAALFSYLVLNFLRFNGKVSKWLAVTFFIVVVAAAVYSIGRFVRHGVMVFPEIADKALPSFVEWTKRYEIDLPFTDLESLREIVLGSAAGQMRHIGTVARITTEAGLQILYVAAGCIAAISIFLNSRFELGREPNVKPNNLYSMAGAQMGIRLRRFYESFATVIGAQIVISAINTCFTGIYALATDLPYAVLVIGVTFLCGLLPVIGNLISNTIIVCIGFTVSPKIALSALIFLIVIHKLEYFLNSGIVGKRIRNPVWITLIGLVVGERLMGLPGIILAPVILHYFKTEVSNIEVKEPVPASVLAEVDS